MPDKRTQLTLKRNYPNPEEKKQIVEKTFARLVTK
jgi:hypothetical protein